MGLDYLSDEKWNGFNTRVSAAGLINQRAVFLGFSGGRSSCWAGNRLQSGFRGCCVCWCGCESGVSRFQRYGYEAPDHAGTGITSPRINVLSSAERGSAKKEGTGWIIDEKFSGCTTPLGRRSDSRSRCSARRLLLLYQNLAALKGCSAALSRSWRSMLTSIHGGSSAGWCG